MQPEERRVAVDAALTQVVSDFGRRISDDPVRLRNLLVDATGANAMTLRDEIDAVVTAAETELPATVLQGDDTARLAAAERLTERLGEERSDLAPWVTETWASALAGTSQRPGATLAAGSTAPEGDATAVADDATAAAADATVAASDATVLPDGATVLPGGATVLAPADAAAEPSEVDRRPILIGVAAVIVVLLIAFFATRGGDDGTGVGNADPGSTTLPTSSGDGGDDPDDGSDDDGGADDTGVIPTGLTGSNDIEVADGVGGTRTLQAGDTSMTTVLEFTNDTTERFRGHWIEVVPAELEAAGLDIGEVDADGPEATMIDDTAFAVALDLEPGETASFSYSTGWTTDELDVFDETFDEYERASETWFEENPDPRSPSLRPDVDSGDTTTNASFTVTGSTEPWNTVTVNGESVDVDADGDFSTRVTLRPGENLLELRAVSPIGATASRDRTVIFDNSPPTTTTTTTTAPPTTTTTTTTAPANRAPVNSCGNDYFALPYDTSYWFSHPFSCYSDPDGDAVTVYSDGGVASPGNCGADNACWTYTPPGTWDGTPYEVTFAVWAQDPDGLSSSASFITLCLNCA